MSKLVYAWEFGANFGHIGAFLPLARTLRQRGHDVRWAVSQTGPAARLLAREGFTWLQAPIGREIPRAGPPLSYNDILLRFGYANGEDLLGLVVAWRELLRLTGAQALLADHAPTAILAARTLGIPVMLFGSGFYAPPRQRPLASMRPWLALPPGQLEHFLLARRVEEMGAGLIVNPEQPPADLEMKLRRVLFEPDFTSNAQAFARKYSNFPQDTVIAHLIHRIEEIAAAAS